MALGGWAGTLLAAAAYWPAIPDAARAAITGPLAGPWLTVAAAGLGLQIAAWTITLVSDRLSHGTLFVMTTAWVATLLGIAVVRETIRLKAVDLAIGGELHQTALGIGGLPVFLVFAVLNAIAIGWCIRTVRIQALRADIR